MTKKEILATLSVIEKQHMDEAVNILEEEGVPNNRGSYLYDVVDPNTGNKYPPPFLLETAYNIASGKKLPKGFFDTIKMNSPHFERIRALGYTIVAKWHDDLDLSSKVWGYKWLYTLTTDQWNRVLDIGKLILDKLDLREDDSKLVISFRDDAKQRLAIIIGSKYVGGFYLEKGEVYVRFYVNNDFDISTDSRLSPDTFEFANKIGKLVYMKIDDWQREQDPLCERMLNDIAHYYEIAPKTNWKRNHLPFMTNVIRSQEPRARFLSFVAKKPQERLIDIYKYFLRTTGNKEELYKWEIGKQFKDNWDLSASNFGDMLSSVKFGNLFSQQSTGFYNLARKNPEDAREYYTHLFDERLTIKDRIEWAKTEGDELIKKWHPKWTTSGGDERTLSVLWAFNDLSRHAPYKSSFYTKYCEFIGVKSASPGEKYEHYLELLDDLIENYILKDTELLNLHNDTIDPKKHIADPKYHLLAQNMLYRILDGYWGGESKSEECNYWVFQGNPKRYDFKSALEKDAIDMWTVSAHKDKIQVGDKVILWITGSESGCYALGEVTEEPFEYNGPKDAFWNEEDTSEWKIGLHITHNFVDRPILKERVNADEVLSKMNVGLQGSNFSATIEQYERLLAMTEESINYKQAFENWLKVNNSESSNMASSYVRAMELLDGVLEYAIFETSNIQQLEELYTDLIDNQRDPKEKYYTAGAPSYGKNGYYSAAISKYIVFHKELKNSTSMSQNNNEPINQILYGPPGTGKTFKLKAQFFDRYTTKETSISKEQHVENVIRECSWWQVIGLALLELKKAKVSDIASHPLVAIKTQLSNSNTVRPTIWGQLQSHTIEECEFVNVKSKQHPFIFNKTEDSFWEILEDETKEQHPELYEILESINNFNPHPDKEIKRYVFTTFHQSYSYEDFIEGIKPVMSEDEVAGSVGYSIENGIFKDLCERASRDSENQYAIFIDEINRGNVSAIFGELITLIEIDKRKNGKNPMSVTLPYSKKLFSVPSNVDIIGTMNTADRSVEALDTALRRRFTFEEMLPKPSLLKETIEGISLEKLLTTINERIEVLVDRDHTIGHAFFINDTTLDNLRNTFANKVIPLLQEYFYGDYSKMEMVIGSAFFDVKETSKVKFAVRSESFEPEGKVYRIKNLTSKEVMSDEDFITALKQLSNTED